MTDFPKKDAPKVQMIEIDDERAGQRIDNFLMSLFRAVPKSLIYRILRTGQVRVNKGRIKPPYRLQAGDIVRVPPVKVPEKSQKREPGQGVLAQVEANIIFEDKGLIVLNKPSGLAVHGGSGVSFGVIEAIRKLKPECKALELVHRLDRDTSGCLLIAKKRSALRSLHEAMRGGEITKIYQALCQGKWKGGERIIDAPLKKNTISSGERIVRVNPDGKQAKSRFEPIRRFKAATLMEVELYTGRTHQIRVHAQHSGHVLAGDDKYGDKDFNKEMRKFGLKRLFLHAHQLRFPWDGITMQVSAPLDDVLESVLDRLK